MKCSFVLLSRRGSCHFPDLPLLITLRCTLSLEALFIASSSFDFTNHTVRYTSILERIHKAASAHYVDCAVVQTFNWKDIPYAVTLYSISHYIVHASVEEEAYSHSIPHSIYQAVANPLIREALFFCFRPYSIENFVGHRSIWETYIALLCSNSLVVLSRIPPFEMCSLPYCALSYQLGGHACLKLKRHLFLASVSFINRILASSCAKRVFDPPFGPILLIELWNMLSLEKWRIHLSHTKLIFNLF